MIVSHPQQVTWTYLVFQEDRPQCGDYVNPRGNHWYVRHVIPEPGVILREPSPPAWWVEMEGRSMEAELLRDAIFNQGARKRMTDYINSRTLPRPAVVLSRYERPWVI